MAVSVGLGLVPAFTVVAKKLSWMAAPAARAIVGGAKFGVMFVVSPAESVPWLVTVAANVAVPAKLPILVMARVATAEPPLGTEIEPGTAWMVKL